MKGAGAGAGAGAKKEQVQEQDHQLRGAKIFERKCCLLVPCQHMQKKTGGGAYYFL
jgi:hypothetical protein